MPRAEQIAKPAEWDALSGAPRSAGLSYSGEGYPTSGPEAQMTRTIHHLPLARRAALVPLTLVLAVATLLACSEQPTGPPAAPSLTPSTASADRGERSRPSGAAATLAWQKTARVLVATHRLAPIIAGRLYALHSVAQYAALQALDGRGEDDDRGDRASNDAQRGAIAGASAQLLSSLLPDVASALETQLAQDGRDASGLTPAQFTRGVAVGRAAGDAMIAWAGRDGYSLVWAESMRNDKVDGTWEGALAVAPATIRPPPMGYQYPTMTTYFLKAKHGHTAQSQFRSLAPPSVSDPTSRFWVDLAEVKSIAASRTDEQTRIANYWNLSVGTPTALGYWNEQAALFIVEHHLDERAASHFFALMNAAVMDATIGCWETKYHYLVMRPTMADNSISLAKGIVGPPAFPFTLPNHPSYPSGHSCVSSAAVTVLSRYFPEHAAALGTALTEAGMSRIYGGIHYRFDIEAGQILGRATAEWAMAYDRREGVLAAVGLGEAKEREHDRR